MAKTHRPICGSCQIDRIKHDSAFETDFFNIYDYFYMKTITVDILKLLKTGIYIINV